MKLERAVVLRVLGLALVLRVIWALACPVVPVDDAYAYDTFAQNLAQGGGYGWKPGEPSLFWAPGTSFVLAALYVVFGHSYLPVVALGVALGVAITGLTMRVAERLHGPKVALYSGLLMAAWPAQIQFTSLLQSELLFEALFLLAFLAFLRIERLPLKVVATGLLLAAASLVRPLAMLAPFLFVFVTTVEPRAWKAALVQGAGVLVVLYLALLPWALRNQAVSGKLVWVSANSGSNLWMGNNPATTGEYMQPPPEVYGLPDLERDERLGKIAKDYIREQPVAFVGRTVKKLIKLHDRETIGVVWNAEGLKSRYGEGILAPLKLLSTLYWWGALALGLLGLASRVWARRWRVIFDPPLVFWGYFAAVHAVVVVMDRYHFPSVPFIAILAGVALQRGLELRAARVR